MSWNQLCARWYAEEVYTLLQGTMGSMLSVDLYDRDWLALVAVHSDSWLYAVAFYYGAKLDQNDR